MSTRPLIRLALLAVLIALAASACQLDRTVTVVDADPLTVTITAYCDRAEGVDVRVDNPGRGRAPVTVQHTYPDPSYDYTTDLVWVRGGGHRTWSWPGSIPPRVVVRLGGVDGLIVADEPVTYPACPPVSP